jgi:N-acetylglucosaminyl-diphospho-decaprenol L-rhamnosyltransferase
MTSRPAVRAVLVNYHCADDVEARLRSGVLTASDEVLIVDNASDPERVQAWESEFGVRSVLLDTNVGFAAAVNEAVRRSRTSAPVLLLNPDLQLTSAVLDALAAALGSPAAGSGRTLDGVAPLLLDSDGGVQVGAAGGPLTLGSVAGYFLLASHLVPALRGVFLTRRQLARGVRADWLCMACLLVRGDAFDRFGPVPEDELVYAEDLAWGTAATAAGAAFQLLPQVRAVHTRGASGGSARWVGAFERTVRARVPGVRGTLAVASVRAGLRLRKALGRRVD